MYPQAKTQCSGRARSAWQPAAITMPARGKPVWRRRARHMISQDKGNSGRRRHVAQLALGSMCDQQRTVAEFGGVIAPHKVFLVEDAQDQRKIGLDAADREIRQ